MRIKYGEGQTLLTFLRVGIFFIACLCVFNVRYLAQAAVNFVYNAESIISNFISEDNEYVSSVKGTPVVLYYNKKAGENGTEYIYQTLYKVEENGRVGLVDTVGKEILPCVYQDIIPLPDMYLLKKNQQWQFYDAGTMSAVNDFYWDDVQIIRAEDNSFDSSWIRVGRGDRYGAVDFSGNIVVEPEYEDLQLGSLSALWPLIKVRKDGLYGFIDYSGNLVVSISYDFVVMDSVTVFADENDATGTEVPIIYLLKDGQWGAVYRDGKGSSAVDWTVEPTSAVLSYYQQQV